MPNPPTLTGIRVVLRAFALSDADRVQQLAGDEMVAATTRNIPHPYKDGMADEWISMHQSLHKNGNGLVYAITHRQKKHLMGAVSLMSIEKQHQAELGYWLGTEYWGKGYTTEAAGLLIEHAFSQLGLIRIYAHCMAGNRASARILTKIGMEHEGTRKLHIRKGNFFDDQEEFGLLLKTWRKKHPTDSKRK